jgi:hypothetical protein
MRGIYTGTRPALIDTHQAEVDSDGNVHASNKPGLGADIDIELIE